MSEDGYLEIRQFSSCSPRFSKVRLWWAQTGELGEEDLLRDIPGARLGRRGMGYLWEKSGPGLGLHVTDASRSTQGPDI